LLDLGVLNDLLGFRLRRIQNHLARAFQDDPRHGDLKSGQFSILALIAANPGVSQARLALEAGIDKTALVALLDYLESAGWAYRVRAKDDRRKHSLHVTDDGMAALNSLTTAAHETEAKARGALTAKELAQLLGILDKLYATCFRESEL
jgi:DNA-binding MarR family transcriptional regulator